MTKHIRLIMVTEDNHNKFYDMDDLGDGNFVVKYGRVDCAPQVKKYPISKWDIVYRNKTSKGYADVTELKLIEDVKEKVKSEKIIHEDKIVASFVEKLLKYANQNIEKNYKISSQLVTKKMVSSAQEILDSLLTIEDVKDFNDSLLKLFSVIPRKMKKVKDYLSNETSEFIEIIKREQDTLDVLAGQVSQNEIVENENTNENNHSDTLLSTLGIEIEKINEKEKQMILNYLGSNSNNFKGAFKVVNKKTQADFDKNIENTKNNEIKLLWHGSRNENWWNIINSGLLLRPTNVVITGKMFGYGIYYANKASKSIGYTSLCGSRWASGKDKNAYLALYSVHVGKQYVIKKHAPWHYDINKSKLISLGHYDSVYAKGGADLINDEFIVYDEHQSTISYIIEIVKN